MCCASEVDKWRCKRLRARYAVTKTSSVYKDVWQHLFLILPNQYWARRLLGQLNSFESFWLYNDRRKLVRSSVISQLSRVVSDPLKYSISLNFGNWARSLRTWIWRRRSCIELVTLARGGR